MKKIKSNDENKLLQTIVLIALIGLITFTIYLFANRLLTGNTTITFSEIISVEDINLIKKTLAVDTSISNIIGVTAIFFTVLVVTVNLFQFLKTKEVENLISTVKDRLNGFNSKVVELDSTTSNIKEELQELSKIRNDMNAIKNCSLFYINMLKAEAEYKLGINNNNNFNDTFITIYYQKCLTILAENKSEKALDIEEEDISRVYSRLGSAYYRSYNFIEAEKYMIESLKYDDTEPDEIIKRIHLASTYSIKNKFEDVLEVLEEIVDKYHQNGIKEIKDTINTKKIQQNAEGNYIATNCFDALLKNSYYKDKVEKLISDFGNEYTINEDTYILAKNGLNINALGFKCNEVQKTPS